MYSVAVPFLFVLRPLCRVRIMCVCVCVTWAEHGVFFSLLFPASLWCPTIYMYENLFHSFISLLCFCARPFCCIFTHLQAYKHTYRNANNPIWRADYCRLHGFVFYFDVLAFFLSLPRFARTSMVGCAACMVTALDCRPVEHGLKRLFRRNTANVAGRTNNGKTEITNCECLNELCIKFVILK